MNLDKRLLRLARNSKLSLFTTIVLGLVVGILTVLLAWFLSHIVSMVFLDGSSLTDVSQSLSILLVIILFRSIASWGSDIASSSIAARVKDNLREQLFQHIQALGPQFSRGERTGELVTAATEGIDALDAYYSQYLPQLLLAALIPTTLLVVIFPLDLLTGVILFITAPLIPVFMLLIGNASKTLTQRQWRSLSRMSAYFLDIIQGLTTLKTLGRSKAQIQVVSQVNEQFRLTTMGVLRITFLSAFALELVATLSTAIVAVEIGIRLLYGRMSFETAFFLLLLAPEFYLPLRLLGTRFHAGMSGVAAANRIFHILDTPLPPEEKKVTGVQTKSKINQPFKTTASDHSPEIIFNDVYFAYSQERSVLRGVSFKIPAGQKVALVGRTGSGKSSIANLLLRFNYPTGGQISVNGHQLDSMHPEEWRSQISWVPQDPYLFNDTVAANIRLGKPNASMDQVIRAARQAHVHGFIKELPQSYETAVGERGVRLSAGQIQRLSLARAFLKSAPFVLLDEATANLDPRLETQLQVSIDHLLGNRSALIIAHRLNTIVKADHILVLEDGQVVESGTHDQLCRQDSTYRKLIQAYSDNTTPHLKSITGGRDIETTAIRPEIANRYSSVPGFIDTPPAQTRNSFQTYRRLLRFITPFKALVALSGLLGFAAIISGVGLLGTSAYLISAAALHPSISALQVAIVGVRFFGISRAFFRYLERLVSHQVTFRVLGNIRVWFYQALEPLAPARLMSYHSGDLLARITGDIETLENFYVRVIAPPFVATLVAIVVGIFLASFNLSFTLVLWFFLLLSGLCLPLLTNRLSRHPNRSMVKLRNDLKVGLIDSIQGMADLMAFNQTNNQALLVKRLSRNLVSVQRRIARIFAFQSTVITFTANICMWVILVLAIPQVHSGQIAGVYLAALLLTALTSFEAVLPLPQAAQHLQSDLQAAQRLFEVVDTQPTVLDPPIPISVPEVVNLEVKNLKFGYPTTAQLIPWIASTQPDSEEIFILKNVNFNLSLGKRMAIVGPSGAGKSTIINLLLRFWDYPEPGKIILGADDLHLYNQDDLRKEFAVVSQKPYLFSTSVRENLLVARPDATQEEIFEAAKGAGIHDFIQSLPDKYNTWIGEHGFLFSAGERQRLAIARALLKNAPLLILDEATANLDAITEREIMQTIHSLMENRILLVITHRLVGLDRMDEILVLDKGRIIERGRHKDLLDLGGLYHQMWELQNQILIED